ncbi:glycosyltransferase family 61 protein [Paenibacillus koleovorans]|uniref:glycosyltransferase family 61 protein n=1 Tax=Paenibacillus koleovorans TaxID=121608 RepID=UPI000FD885E4|nr:glycosyltransferase family 61 protein [Paenibacillus koleovorans]
MNVLTPRFKEEPVVLKAPTGVEHPLHWMFREMEGRADQRVGEVMVVPGGRVYGSGSCIVDADGKPLDNPQKKKNGQPAAAEPSPALPTYAKHVALLTHDVAGNYYHWMLDVLPCLLLMHKCGLRVDKYVLNGLKTFPLQYESLKALGVPGRKIEASSETMHMKAANLIVPYFGRRSCRPPYSVKFVRNELLKAYDPKPVKGYERIYLSRAGTRRRRVTNEVEVMRLMSEYGFKLISPEQLSMATQIEIFSSAKVIAGPHGSAFTNLIFCKPGTKVIELFSPQYVGRHFPILSSIMGLRHYYLMGEGARPPEHSKLKDTRPDMTINIRDLQRLLSLASVHPRIKQD